MKKALLLLLLGESALAHDGHGAASLFHLHGAELIAVALIALVLAGMPVAYRKWLKKHR